MSKKNNNVFTALIELFNRIADELETTNSYLFGIGGELAEQNEHLKDVVDRLEFIAVTLDSLAEKPAKPTEAKLPTETYQPV